MNSVSRRDFLKSTSVVAAGALIIPNLLSCSPNNRLNIALIGCGAYGFPLAAHVKRKGKKAVLLGGALQILFGIKGKRWEEHPQISRLMNEHWTRPLKNEVPNNSVKIDGGSYW